VRVGLRRLGTVALAAFALTALAFLFAGCGSSSKTQAATGGTTTASAPPIQAHLTAAQYRARLKRINAEVTKTQSSIRAQFTQAKSTADIRRALKKVGDGELRLSQEVGKLRAPPNAKTANALLAKGFADLAKEVKAIEPKVAAAKNPQAAVAILKSLQPTGGKEIDTAVSELKKLGYTSGS
jgi:phage replication-related protein YjqB (UPF0714/DUF867 family)